MRRGRERAGRRGRAPRPAVWSVVAIVLGVGGALVSCGAPATLEGGAAAGETEGSSLAPRTAGSPMFLADPAHARRTETRGIPALGGVAWRFDAEGPVRSTPALVGDTLYVGGSDGRVHAVRAADGAALWSYEAGAPVASSPAVVGRLVLFGDRANVLHALDRARGEPVWRLETGPDRPLPWGWEGWDYLGSSPVPVEAPGDADAGSSGGRARGASGTLVLFGSGDGSLYAVDAASGEVLWRHETARRIRSTPAVAAGTVYLGGGDGVLYALDVRTGALRWTFATSGVAYDAAEFGFDRTQIQGSPAVVDGTLYVGSRDASLYAIDARSGELRWHREDGTAWVVGTPVVRDGTLYNGRSSSGRFRAIDAATGEERWVVEAGGPVVSSPALVDDVVYVGSGSGEVLALDALTGETRWRFHTGAPVFSSPVVADGRLYIGSDDGGLYALEATDGLSPRLAVYRDDALESRSVWGGREVHRRATEYFESRGYERLDGPGLASFLQARIRDGAPSVVVFGMDALPRSVASPSDTALLRRYLDAGGKVVWLGFPPLILARDAEGRVTDVERDAPRALLDVDVSAWNSDVYGVRPTAEGRRWGLARWSRAGPSAAVGAVDAVLAIDELGRAAAWVREYGGPPGTGFVLLPASTETSRLDEIRRVAEVGIMRPFPFRSPDR